MSEIIGSADHVVRALLDGIAAGPTEELACLYAEDAVVELPYAKPGGLRLQGRDQIRQHFARAAAAPFRLTPERLTVHRTRDDEVVIAEYDYAGEVLATGRRFTVSNVQLVRVRAGWIQHSRDFHDHAGMSAALRRG